ncbi:MAG: nucleotide pyrophosphohydrolase [Desulfobulbaceae bacterium]|nr:MAG: nucleotide pyrophosphohydrolase [Desulfobulbaceae bacterium]
MTKTHQPKKLVEALIDFASQRDWQQYHSPKNLAMALSVECSELLEIFQWLTQDESKDLKGAELQHLKEEIGDVMIYLTMLGQHFSIDPVAAAFDKLEQNEKKYPAP